MPPNCHRRTDECFTHQLLLPAAIDESIPRGNGSLAQPSSVSCSGAIASSTRQGGGAFSWRSPSAAAAASTGGRLLGMLTSAAGGGPPPMEALLHVLPVRL
mmetsp:Transcript_27897/g.72421  ORF Transcript_27897/g.72421 Transcript_27897/m.72421 type:complete len:101 (-) Transcript_27897:716-1018(-)